MSQNSNVVCFKGTDMIGVNSTEKLEKLLDSKNLQVSNKHVVLLEGRGLTVPSDRIYSV